jgi:hypothetical protein
MVCFIVMLSNSDDVRASGSPERRQAGPVGSRRRVAHGGFCRCAADGIFRHMRENNTGRRKTARFRETENESPLCGASWGPLRGLLGGAGLEIWLATDFGVAQTNGVGGRRVRTRGLQEERGGTGRRLWAMTTGSLSICYLPMNNAEYSMRIERTALRLARRVSCGVRTRRALGSLPGFQSGAIAPHSKTLARLAPLGRVRARRISRGLRWRCGGRRQGGSGAFAMAGEGFHGAEAWVGGRDRTHGTQGTDVGWGWGEVAWQGWAWARGGDGGLRKGGGEAMGRGGLKAKGRGCMKQERKREVKGSENSNKGRPDPFPVLWPNLGEPLGLGRSRRSVTAALRGAIRGGLLFEGMGKG